MPLSFSRGSLDEVSAERSRLVDLTYPHRAEGAGSDEEGSMPHADEHKAAMEKAGRILARRPHSRREIEQRLAGAGYGQPTVEGVLDRLEALGLVDDLVFARQWVEERGRRKGARLLRAELAVKGVPREVADEALASVGLDEEAAALALAAGWVRKVVNRPLAEQAGRIRQMLVRRGYPVEVAEEAARAVLPLEGWD